MPPPDTTLSAVGGGAATPAPAACTAVAGAGEAADGDDCAVGLPVGRGESVPIMTRILPAGSVPRACVGRPPSVPARRDALAAAPAPYSMTETCTRVGPVLAFPPLNPRVLSARSSWSARPGRPEALTASTRRCAAVPGEPLWRLTGAGMA